MARTLGSRRRRSRHVSTEKPLPPRSLDTMSEAIALSSPSGKISKKAKAAGVKRLGEDLFGPGGLKKAEVKQPGRKESLLRRAKELRQLAIRGMSPRKLNKEADKLESEASRL